MNEIEMFRKIFSLFGNPENSVKIFGVQHLLPTQNFLFRALRDFGLTNRLPNIVGKIYSTVNSLDHLDSFWSVEPRTDFRFERGKFHKAYQYWIQKNLTNDFLTFPIEGGVVLDDGGFLAKRISSLGNLKNGTGVCFIEQTTSGIRHAQKSLFPTISVATSSVKRHIESILVAETVIDALKRQGYILSSSQTIGIVGYGWIGYSLARELHRQGFRKIIVWDKEDIDPLISQRNCNSEGGIAKQMNNVEEILEKSDIVFGCTGSSALEGVIFGDLKRSSNRPIYLASCSSTDIEFAALLRCPRASEIQFSAGINKSWENINGKIEQFEFVILNGGFPVNFDRTNESDPSHYFLLTRLLMFGAILQAMDMISNNEISAKGLHSLDPQIQQEVFKVWLESQPLFAQRIDPDILENFENIEWIESESKIGNTPLKSFDRNLPDESAA